MVNASQSSQEDIDHGREEEKTFDLADMPEVPHIEPDQHKDDEKRTPLKKEIKQQMKQINEDSNEDFKKAKWDGEHQMVSFDSEEYQKFLKLLEFNHSTKHKHSYICLTCW